MLFAARPALRQLPGVQGLKLAPIFGLNPALLCRGDLSAFFRGQVNRRRRRPPLLNAFLGPGHHEQIEIAAIRAAPLPIDN
jgi:hypothetical protein